MHQLYKIESFNMADSHIVTTIKMKPCVAQSLSPNDLSL